MKKQKIIFKLSQLNDVATTVLESIKDVEIVALQGSLGAGKTTFTAAMLKKLGVCDVIQSPTFTYLQAYRGANDQMMYHFDLYRLKNQESFIFSGFDEFLYQPNSKVFIEWPEVILPLIQQNVCFIELFYRDEDTREIVWFCQ